MYRQSPVKSPDIKTTINIVTVSHSFTQPSTLAKTHTTTAREPSMYAIVPLNIIYFTQGPLINYVTQLGEVGGKHLCYSSIKK